MKRNSAAFLATALLLCLGACSDDPTAPQVTQVVVNPGSLQLNAVGATGALTAQVSAGAAAVTNATVAWTSSAPSVATVTASGTTASVTATSDGTATITASSSGKTATAVVTVSTPRQLTVTLAGAGAGTVSSAPSGIVNCARASGTTSGTCNNNYNAGTAVTLTATVGANSAFDGWAGACTGAGSCVLTMDQAKSVTATFSQLPQTLNVETAGTGDGTVASAPAAITCARTAGATSGTCTAPFAFGTSVTLTATPVAGSAFTGWTGACTGSATCTVSMDQARSVTTTFTFITNTLTITMAGVGGGTVTSAPAGVNCTRDGAGTTGTCSSAFVPGTSVTLTAIVGFAQVFAGWSGGVCTGTAACVVTMDQSRTVTATFDNPCFLSGYSIGTTVSGTITNIPCPRLSGTPTNLYFYTVAAQTLFRADATSTNATTRVAGLVGSFGTVFAGSASTAATGLALVPAGTWTIGVLQTTPGSTYSFTTTVNPSLSANCETIWVTQGVSADPTLFTAPTCTAYTPTGLPLTAARQMLLTLPANRELKVTVTSTAFQPVIELVNANTSAVVKTTATDAASGTATFTFTTGVTTGYRIWVTSRAAGAAGTYHIVIDP